MSLVSTYVEDQAGRWYKDPHIVRDDWFICWDDDDPIELVTLKHVKHQDVLAMLAKLGWVLRVSSRGCSGNRLFPPTSDGSFKSANSYFVKQVHKGPPPGLMDNEYRLDQKPCGQGVYYYSSPNGNGGVF